MVGNIGIMVSKVIGMNISGSKNVIVTDSSMAEFIRPSLYEYDVFKFISLIEPEGKMEKFDVVAPVCASADFLVKELILSFPIETSGLALLHSGAYCYAMASNYNMKVKPAEILVYGNSWTIICRAETFDGLMAGNTTEEVLAYILSIILQLRFDSDEISKRLACDMRIEIIR